MPMSLGEFELIERFFARAAGRRADVIVGIGDDAAVLRVPEGAELVAATDTLIAGVHFPVDTAPDAIGHKALAVNLSDLAAMGAEPAWAMLALTLPEADEAWLGEFARGFLALAGCHRMALVGGDTTRGPLSVTVQVLGWVPRGSALRRAGERPREHPPIPKKPGDTAPPPEGPWGERGEGCGGGRGGGVLCCAGAHPCDHLYVTGTLGDAALALEGLRGARRVPRAALAALRRRLDRPEPRIEAGLALRGVASAAIDVSDGLLADAGHLARAGGVGITVWPQALPRSADYRTASGGEEDWEAALSGGDDYELCFSVPPGREEALRALGCPVTRIGVVEAGSGVHCLRRDGSPLHPTQAGYTHFPGSQT